MDAVSSFLWISIMDNICNQVVGCVLVLCFDFRTKYVTKVHVSKKNIELFLHLC